MSRTPESYPQPPFRLPEGATEILLVRHGASQAHVPGESFEVIEGGHADPPLSREGQHQAALLAPRLLREQITSLFVTPLQRTHETAAPFATARGVVPVVVEELREVHLGDWENGEIRVRAVKGDPILDEVIARQRWDAIPGAESMESLGARVRAGVERIVEQVGPGGRAIAVLHGGVIGEICHQAVGGGPRLALVAVENASVSSIVVRPSGRWQLRSYNDTTHLR